MKKINSIRIEHVHDDDPDLSYLGEYSRSPGAHGSFTIDRQKEGDWQRNELRYFIADNCENWEQARQNYQHMEAYNNQGWYMIGVRVVAECFSSRDGKHWKSTEFKSAGLWGIESDSDESHLQNVALEQLAELRDELEEYGFTNAEVKAAFSKHNFELAD